MGYEKGKMNSEIYMECGYPDSSGNGLSSTLMKLPAEVGVKKLGDHIYSF